MKFFPGTAPILTLSILLATTLSRAEDLPVRVPDDWALHNTRARNPITFEQLHNIAPTTSGKALRLDLNDPSFDGRIYTGPYPFEADEADLDYARYRASGSLADGAGLLPVEDFFHDPLNANDWPKPVTTLGYRLDLWRRNAKGIPAPYGYYDSIVTFRRLPDASGKSVRYEKALTITEGPFVALACSDDPTAVRIVWETDEPCTGAVHVAPDREPAEFRLAGRSTAAAKRHDVAVAGLTPATAYRYYVECPDAAGRPTRSEPVAFRTAPRPGEGRVVFAFASDSRDGVGSLDEAYMGVNLAVLSRIAQDAYRRGAELFVFGGDLAVGYTSQVDDFRLMLRGFKQAVAPFWRTRPVYTAMGNHESLSHIYTGKRDGRQVSVSLDKWPYAADSAEAIFAEQFWNPTNGPVPSDARRPPYAETVYRFQYGPVFFLAFNNNYWWTTNAEIPNFGGCLEGYILDDQLDWIEAALARADADPTVRYIVLYAQEPAFPCGGHVRDAMWWGGDNRVRAWTWTGREMQPADAGIIQVRNRLWRAVAASPKTAALLVGDEHAYVRTRIDAQTPVGVLPDDDTNGDGKLDRTSPDPAFQHPTWHVTVGTAGAPYYAREKTPWTPTLFSSQSGYALFEADARKISMTFYSITGQAVDRVDDLMAIKKN